MSHERLLEVLDKLDEKFDDFFVSNIRREIAQLRNALESGDDEEIETALCDTIDGCDTAMARLSDADWLLEKMNTARKAYEMDTDLTNIRE
jgi:lipoate-protein ligase A